MASHREEITRAVVAALRAPGGPPGLRVHRFRASDIASDQLPAAVVYPITESVEREDMDGGVDRSLLLRIEIRVAGDEPDAALDPFYAWAVRAITTDPALAGLAYSIDEQLTAWDAEHRDRTYGALAVDFEIMYTTARGDPAVTPGA